MKNFESKVEISSFLKVKNRVKLGTRSFVSLVAELENMLNAKKQTVGGAIAMVSLFAEIWCRSPNSKFVKNTEKNFTENQRRNESGN